MSNAETIAKYAGFLDKLKGLALWTLAFIIQRRYVALFMFVRKDHGDPEFLQVFHRDWGCYLFPGAEINPDSTNEEWIAKRCAGKVGVGTEASLSYKDIIPQRMERLDFATLKRSGSDLSWRVYAYRIYLVRFRNHKQWDEFDSNVEKTGDVKWMSYNELLNDRITFRKNKDVIRQIGQRMNKGHSLQASWP